MQTVRTLSRVSSLVLLAAIGAVVALLLLHFIGQNSNPTLGAAIPAGKRVDQGVLASTLTLSKRPISAVDELTADAERDSSERPAVNEVIPALRGITQSADIASVSADHDGSQRSRGLANGQSSVARSKGSVDAGVPLGWCFRAQSGFTWLDAHAGPGPQHEFASDTSVVWQGSASARIGAADESLPPDVVGVMWQAIVATPLRGKRVEVSAYVRSRISLPGRPWVGHLFVRTQGKAPLELLLSDQNAPGEQGLNRYVPRNVEWDRYGVVLDVPSDAEVMYYGFALYGGGYAWIDDVRISLAETSSEVTHYGSVGGNRNIAIDPSWVLPAPLNLGFELTSDGPTGGAEASDPACTRDSANG